MEMRWNEKIRYTFSVPLSGEVGSIALRGVRLEVRRPVRRLEH